MSSTMSHVTTEGGIFSYDPSDPSDRARVCDLAGVADADLDPMPETPTAEGERPRLATVRTASGTYNFDPANAVDTKRASHVSGVPAERLAEVEPGETFEPGGESES